MFSLERKEELGRLDIMPVPAVSDTPLRGIELFQCVSPDRLGRFKELIAQNVDINEQDEDGYTALTCATMMSEDNEQFYILLEEGADPDIPTIGRNRTPLMQLAERKGEIKRLQALIDAGADVNLLDIYGYSALRYAISEGCLSQFIALIEAGAFINAGALHDTVRSTKYLDHLSILIKAGADLDILDDDGKTALEIAKLYDNQEAFLLLS